MRVKATGRFVRTSPRKARLVTDLIRGKNVNEALGILRFTNKGVANEIAKIVRSAAANAENNFMLDADNLYVAAVYADDGPTLKRMDFGSRGRLKPYVKRTSHITVEVDEVGSADEDLA